MRASIKGPISQSTSGDKNKIEMGLDGNIGLTVVE